MDCAPYWRRIVEADGAVCSGLEPAGNALPPNELEEY